MSYKQFPIENGRYIVFLFKTNQFEGTLTSSSEGEMKWIKRDEVSKVKTVYDFEELLSVLDNDDLTEFMYVKNGDNWTIEIR